MSVAKYNKPMIILHWIMLFFILGSLVAGGVVLENLDNSDPQKIQMLTGHAQIGLLIGVLMLIRLVIRLRSTLPESPNAGNPKAERVEKLVHWGFYVLVFAMVLSGVGTMILSGAGEVIQSGEGALPESFSDYPTMLVHAIVSKLLMLLIVLHLVAVIKHKVVTGTSLMARMSLRK